MEMTISTMSSWHIWTEAQTDRTYKHSYIKG